MPTKLSSLGLESTPDERLHERLRELIANHPVTSAMYRWIRDCPAVDLPALIHETKEYLAPMAADRRRYKWSAKEIAEKTEEFLEQNLKYAIDFKELARLLLWELDPAVGALLLSDPSAEHEAEDDEEEVTEDDATP